jgi:hypothetical protein
MLGADDLVVKIGADFSGLKDGLDKAGTEVKKFSGDSSKGVKELGDAVGFSVAKFQIYVEVIKKVSDALVTMVTEQVKYATELDRLSNRLGISNEKFSQMAAVVKTVGANQEDLYDVIKELGNKIKEAEEGNKTYQKSLDRIGLSYHMLSMLTPEQQLYYFADGLKRASAEAQKLSIDELVSDPGMRMINVLNKGSDALKGMMEAADKAGVSLKKAEFDKFKILEETFRKTEEASGALAKRISGYLVPALTSMSEGTTKAIADTNAFLDFLEKVPARMKAVNTVIKQIQTELANPNVTHVTSSAAIKLNAVADSSKSVADQTAATTAQINMFTESLKSAAVVMEEVKDPSFKLPAAELPTMVVTGEDDQPSAPFFGPENLEVQRDILEQAMFDYQQYREQIGTMQADYNAQMYADEKRNQDAHRLLWESSWKGKAKITSDILDNLSTLMNSKSRKMFEIGKVAATSGAIIDTIAAAQKSYSSLAGIPYVGPALGAAAAAAAIAAGMVRVQQIQSTSFGGGGAGGGGAGPGVAGTPQPAEVINQTNVDVSLQGSNFTGDQVRGLISSINGAISDGAKLNSITVK